MKKSITIKKDVATKDDLDFNFLKKEGIKHIEKLGSALWTDYNVHDPGITMLEMLCYAITDLSQRIEIPIESLLASQEDNFKKMHEQFLSAVEILPIRPVSELDYRNLFTHIKGVKNAWIKKHTQNIYINCDKYPQEWSYKKFNMPLKKQKSFSLKGLNDIYIDLEPGVKIGDVRPKIKEAYLNNRNLCEDLVKIAAIPEQQICVCTYIDLETDANEDKVQALIQIAIDEYLSPSISFYSLEEMQKKGYTTDQIFEGPVLMPGACFNMNDVKQGFIDYKELEEAGLRKEVRLSDLINIIMEIEGVKDVKDISISSCAGFSEQTPWIICIEENHKPKLNLNKSLFNFSKGQLPVTTETSKIRAYIKEEKDKIALRQGSIKTEDIEMPLGTYLNPGEYTTIQNDFPETYGISEYGLPKDAPNKRKAQASQLKAYLLFFDQVLANYFAHLGKVKDLLSIDENLKKLYVDKTISLLPKTSQTYKLVTQYYATQQVADLTGVEKLLDTVDYDKNLLEAVRKCLDEKPDDNFYRKRNELLDHLIARFAEQFSEYTFIMKMLYGNMADDYTLEAKIKFILEYKKISCERGTSFNYCSSEFWDTFNVSGVERRIAKLAGINDYSRRNLLYDFVEVYDEKDEVDDNVVEYRWRVKDGDKILLSSSKRYLTIHETYEEISLSLKYAQDKANYIIKKSDKNQQFYIDLVNPTVKDTTSEAWIISRKIDFFDTKAEAQAVRDEIVEFIKKQTIGEEGMYMVEHILLRPDRYNASGGTGTDVITSDFMETCLKPDCTSDEPIDPYSFRVTVILPGWTQRFGNIDFRNYLERIIREELPAHVLARICWVGHIKGLVPDSKNDMLQIQKKYKGLLNQLQLMCKNQPPSKNEIKRYRQTLKRFTNQLNKIHTIYSAGRLHDCENDNVSGKIVLGKANLGNL